MRRPSALHRRLRSALGATLFVALPGCAPAAPPLPAPESLVLISIDTLRADHLGCYGNEVVETPHMDRLAREGVLFEACASAAPSTLCSHTSLMTGTYPHTHGTPRNGWQVPEHNVMLAEVLREAGWRTAAVIGAFPLRARFDFDQGFDHFDDQGYTRDGAQVNEGVERWLDAEAERGVTGPFFLFVHYWDAHYPYDPPPPWDRRYRTDDTRLERTKDEIREVSANLSAGLDESARSEALRGLYAGGVSYVDTHVGALVALLEARGLLDTTLLVLTADHGEAMDEHWEYWDHGESTYETSIHVPLVLRLPGATLAGTRRPEPVSHVDVMPTLLELLGRPRPDSVEGLSLVPLLRAAEDVPLPPVFAEGTKPHTEAYESGPWTNARKCRSVRDGRWKLIHRPVEDRLELYDLAADPGETRDLAALEPDRHADRIRSMSERLATWSALVPETVGEHDLSPETQRQLEALGYFENQ